MEIENTEEKVLDPMLQEYLNSLETEVEEEEIAEEVIEEKVDEVTTEEEKVVETEEKEVVAEVEIPEPKVIEPEFKSDKDRWMYEKIKAGEEKEVFEKLNEKYGFERLTDEEKMLAYLGAKNPHLDKEDLAFKAQDYGIGVEAIDLEDLTETEKRELRKQAIDRKGLLAEADSFFKERQEAIELPSLANPIDADEDYKAYKAQVAEQVEIQKQEQEYTEQINKDIDTTAKVLERVGVEVKIDIDNGEFDVNVQFDLDDKKRKQLADFAKVYTPTQEQISAHTDANGKFDMKGYMTGLANIRFSSQIINAAVKQAIVKDREAFEERELKNSTLNNREVGQQSAPEVSEEIRLMRL